MKCWAVVVAAGRGTRTGLSTNKVFYPMGGVSILKRSLLALKESGMIEGAVIVISRDDEENYRALCEREKPMPLVRAVAYGGTIRQESVLNGLRAVPEDVELVAIHDAARPFVQPVVICRAIEDAMRYGAGIAAAEMIDTVKMVNAEGLALSTPDRSQMRSVQTPQVFRRTQILQAHEMAAREGFTATDDAALVERYFGPVHLSVTSEGLANIKITTREDIERMNGLLAGTLRVGHGFDAHRLVPGRPLVLCGVTIPGELGLEGHSDADVALHALMDAMLGAAGLGDIGRMFPDNDPATEGISSIVLLEKVRGRLRASGLKVLNCDLTIVAQKPKLAPYIEQMRRHIAQTLELAEERTNVKATTTEHMGYEGRGEGISAHCVVLIGG